MPSTYSTRNSRGAQRPSAWARSSHYGVPEESIASDDPELAVIAVMGPTGTGKSTLVNLVSGSNLEVGEDLESCTSVVQAGKPFYLDGRHVILIDTPGFDDTTLSDVDVLELIAVFLELTYKRSIKLTGILYLHRISDNRVSGTLKKNFRMFQGLCGEKTLRNVVIVTNMWEGVSHLMGEKREAELRGKDIYFKPVLEKHAQMTRHENTVDSAQRILRLILHNPPLPQRIQEEIVDEGKDISNTRAGAELKRELDAQIIKHQEELRALEEKMRQAMQDKAEKAEKILARRIKQSKDKIEAIKIKSTKMPDNYRRTVDTVGANSLGIQRELEGDPTVLPFLIPILSITGGTTLYSLAKAGVVRVLTGVIEIAAWIIRKITGVSRRKADALAR